MTTFSFKTRAHTLYKQNGNLEYKYQYLYQHFMVYQYSLAYQFSGTKFKLDIGIKYCRVDIMYIAQLYPSHVMQFCSIGTIITRAKNCNLVWVETK